LYLSRKIFYFFGNNQKEVNLHENMEKNLPFLSGRYALLRFGTALAGTNPWEHVSFGRLVLFDIGTGGSLAAESVCPGGVGRFVHYGGGIGGGDAGEPAVSSVGLPQPAHEFSGTDLPQVHVVLDSSQSHWFSGVSKNRRPAASKISFYLNGIFIPPGGLRDGEKWPKMMPKCIG
jgi:hypothetical protein